MQTTEVDLVVQLQKAQNKVNTIQEQINEKKKIEVAEIMAKQKEVGCGFGKHIKVVFFVAETQQEIKAHCLNCKCSVSGVEVINQLNYYDSVISGDNSKREKEKEFYRW